MLSQQMFLMILFPCCVWQSIQLFSLEQHAPGPVILYMHDIGGPIGMRIATGHPEQIAGLIFQNTTISREGWNPAILEVYERIGGPETPDKLAQAEQLVTVGRDKFLHQSGQSAN